LYGVAGRRSRMDQAGNGLPISELGERYAIG
jgi:hypothetical protein